MINSKNYLHQRFFCVRFYLKNVLNFFIEETFEKIVLWFMPAWPTPFHRIGHLNFELTQED
jgi:hypothetical protein